MLSNTIIHQHFNNFEIIQHLKERIQIKAPSLFHDPERARIFEMLLCKSDAVYTANVSTATASADIQYDPAKLGAEKLFIHLDWLLAALGHKVSSTIDQVQTRVVKRQKAETVYSFSITGMACPSCALSLELLLSREVGISAVKVDYESKILSIHSNMASNKIIKLVGNAGFKAVISVS